MDIHKLLRFMVEKGASDAFIGANDDVLAENEDWGIDFEAAIRATVGRPCSPHQKPYELIDGAFDHAALHQQPR